MSLTINNLYAFLFAEALSTARLGPCFILVPVFSFNVIKGLPRSGALLALGLIPACAIQPQLALSMPELMPMIGLLIKELVIGLLLGCILSMPFWLWQSVGALFDNQRGALIGGQLNPALGTDQTPLGMLLQQTLILLLVCGAGVSHFMQIIWDSYRIWPALHWLPAPGIQGFHQYLDLLGSTFSHIIIYAGPLVALLLMLDFSIALLSLYSPQLQATVLAVPAKCLLGLLFFVIYLTSLNELGQQRLMELNDLQHQLPILFLTGTR